MRTTSVLHLSILAIGIAMLLTVWPVRLSSQQNAPVRIDNDDIGGVVTSANGPEAGVWVIAETTDLPTKFAKIVVTDDQGRYVIPDLPKANYNIWVRGYGLVDSPKIKAVPGKILNLKGIVASSEAAAAEYYPAIYWYSMLKIPDKSLFPGTGEKGNGMPVAAKSQDQWLDSVKTNGCIGCHQLGNKATRTIPKAFADLKPSSDAWARRIQSGQARTSMIDQIARFDAGRALQLYADWTDRIAAGELPKSKPSRPQGVERNIVITMWDWSRPTFYLHDEIATDRRNPTLKANGKIYGAPEYSTDYLPVLDPMKNQVSEIKVPVRDPKTATSKTDPMSPSPYWGDTPTWDSQTNTHNPMMDQKGRAWFTTRIRPEQNPAFCQKGSEHPSAKLFPTRTSGRQVSMFDPKTNKFTLIDTCFGTHHLVFAEDANNTLWLSGSREVLGWINTKLFDETGDEQKSQGWTAFVVDTNGNGKRDEYTEPNQPLDPTKDRRLVVSTYGIGVAPDGSVWTFDPGLPRLHRPHGSRFRPGVRPRCRKSTRCPGTTRRSRAMGRGEWMSIGTALSGCRCRAGTWRASIAASAMGRSTDRRPRRDSSGRKAGHCIRIPDRSSTTSRNRAAWSPPITPGWTSTTRWPWEGRTDVHRQFERRSPCFGRREICHASRALPHGLLHQRHGRADRRSQRRLESQGPMVDHKYASAVPHGRRQRNQAQGRQIPGSPRSAGEVRRITIQRNSVPGPRSTAGGELRDADAMSQFIQLLDIEGRAHKT